MPIYMDRHYIEGATQHSVRNAHQQDLRVQGKYGIRFLSYWFDEQRFTAFCLIDAPDTDTIVKVHQEAHGLVPNEIIEVDPKAVEAFLGRVADPAPKSDGSVAVDAALRTIMFTDLHDSTTITQRLGDVQAVGMLRIHNALIRAALREHAGREVKHTGDGIMASFLSAENGVRAAIAIQHAFANYNREHPSMEMHLRVGLSAGEPVQEGADLFGATVQLASRLCNLADPDQVLAEASVKELIDTTDLMFVGLGERLVKGFDRPVSVYQVEWR